MRAPSRPHATYATAVGAAVLMSAAIVAVHRESFRTLISAHGLLHTAIAEELMTRWLPERPQNPFFAGEPLPYYWFYHWLAAILARATGTHPLVAFEALTLLGVILIWLVGVAIGRNLGWRPGATLAIPVLAFAGANPFSGVLLLGKLAVGHPWPADDGTYLWGLAHPAMSLARFNDGGALYGPLVNFFLNPSSRGLALALVLAVALAVLRGRHSNATGSLLMVALASAACTAVSPIIGLLAALALASALALEWLWSLVRRAPGASAPWRLASALLIGALLSLPTYYHLFARSGQAAIVIGFRPDLVGTLAVSIGPALCLAWIGARRSATSETRVGFLMVACVGLCLGNVLVSLPSGNDSNLFHVGAFLLAVPAAAGLAALRGAPALVRLAGGVLIAVLLLSASGIVFWSYMHRPAVTIALRGNRLVRSVDDARARAYQWVRSTTPANAVIITDDGIGRHADVGNVPELPALAGRPLFVANDPDYMVAGYTDSRRRQQIASAMINGSALATDDVGYLEALRRPIFLLLNSPTPAAIDRLTTEYGAPAYRDDDIAIVQVSPGGAPEVR